MNSPSEKIAAMVSMSEMVRVTTVPIGVLSKKLSFRLIICLYILLLIMLSFFENFEKQIYRLRGDVSPDYKKTAADAKN